VFTPVQGGAHGVSFATDGGVVAEVVPAEEVAVTLDGEPTGFAPVALALDALDVAARVELTAEVPVGRGFGASGAATLATVLAADATFDLGRERAELVEVAATAEVEAGTGLGDVYVQDRGGLVWNVGDGREHRRISAPVSYESYGPIATEDVLGDDDAMARVRAAGVNAIADFDPGMGMAALFERSWQFARETELPTESVRDAVARVEAAGGAATMAMVGETVVAMADDGTLAGQTRIASKGATVLDE
jgi:pantoate kinase